MYDLVAASADYPHRDEPPARTLVVCTQQRSGSTLVGEAIYFARGLGCPLEYFHPGFRPAFQTRWAATTIGEYVTALHRHRTDPSGVFSAKLFWWDVVELVREMAPGEFDALPTARASATPDRTYRRIRATIAPCLPRATFIALTRRDEIGQAISLAAAGQTGRWRDLRHEGTAPRQPIACNFDQIVQGLGAIQNDNAHWSNFFRANDLPHQPLVYEDLAADYEGTLRTLFRALGRPGAPITPPRLRRQADERSEEIRREFLGEFQRRVHG